MIAAYVGLGANLGDRAVNVHWAVSRLAATDGIQVTRVSSLVENEAVGGPADSPPFLNAVAEIDTSLSAPSVLARLLAIESEMGRVRRQRWEPRIIDLDLILYGNQIIDEPGLTIPHPRMHERTFVLKPLAEIAADFVHPGLNKTIRALLDERLAGS